MDIYRVDNKEYTHIMSVCFNQSIIKVEQEKELKEVKEAMIEEIKQQGFESENIIWELQPEKITRANPLHHGRVWLIARFTVEK